MSLWPEVRYIHAAAVIPGSSPMLLISGGRDNSDDIIDDFWILDITEYSWIKVNAVLHLYVVDKLHMNCHK